MAVLFGWNNDEIIGFTAKLDKIHRAALPNAVRSTLNDAAFGMKQKSILAGARKDMTVRHSSVFKAYSAVNKATGWKINSMVSDAGIVPKSTSAKANPKSRFGTQIAKQEFGGSVDHKAYIAHSDSRSGKGLVSKNGRTVLQNKRKPIVYRGEKKRHKNFVTSAYDAFAQNRALLATTDDTGILYKVVKFNDKKAKLRFKLKKVASYENNRMVPIKKKRSFIKDAAILEEKKLNGYFRKEADRQLNKFMR